jgi:uncharacterized membrane protein
VNLFPPEKIATNRRVCCLTDMKTLRSFFYFAAIAIAFANFASFAQAQTPAQRQQGFGAGDRFSPALNRVLTDDQRKAFHTAIDSQSEKIRPLEQKMRESRHAMLDEIASGQFNEAAARQNAEESAKGRGGTHGGFCKGAFANAAAAFGAANRTDEKFPAGSKSAAIAIRAASGSCTKAENRFTAAAAARFK